MSGVTADSRPVSEALSSMVVDRLRPRYPRAAEILENALVPGGSVWSMYWPRWTDDLTGEVHEAWTGIYIESVVSVDENIEKIEEQILFGFAWFGGQATRVFVCPLLDFHP